MRVRMHRKGPAERLAEFAQMLHLPHAAPEMMVAEDDLHSVALDRFRQVGERGHGDVARQGRGDAAPQKLPRAAAISPSPATGSSR